MPTDSRTVLVLGAGGRFGRVATAAFAASGWRVLAQARRPLDGLPPGAHLVACNALDTNAMLAACKDGVDVIVNALNPQYTEWEARVPALSGAALHLAGVTGALLMLPGNIYNFGRALPPVLRESTPQSPDTSKAAIRIALENRMCDAAAEGVRSAVIRAGDFLGGPGPGTWLDMVIAKNLRKGHLAYPGPLGIEHAWAYLPDLARVFVAVAERRGQLQPFEVLHYAGLSLTGTELHAAFERVAGAPLPVKGFPWWLLRVAAPFSPMMRAVLEMRYLWERAHRLDQSRLEGLIGSVPRTPIDEVLRAFLQQQGHVTTSGMEPVQARR